MTAVGRSLVRLAALLPLAIATPLVAQQPPAPIACGFLLRQGQHVMPGQAGDSVRRSGEVPRLVSTLRAQLGNGERIRIERSRGWIGVQMTEVIEARTTADGRLVRYCDYPVVVSVEPASPAERAGLESGDTVWAYNGVDLRRVGEVALDHLLIPDDTLRVGVRRSGRALTFPLVVARRPEGMHVSPGSASYSYVFVTPGPRGPGVPSAPSPARSAAPVAAPLPPPPPAAPLFFPFGSGGSALAGAQLVAMDDDLRAAVGAKAGVLVLKVAEGTPAGEAGLRAGDVIVSAGGRAVTAPAALQQIFLREATARALPLRVERRGKTREVVLRW